MWIRTQDFLLLANVVINISVISSLQPNRNLNLSSTTPQPPSDKKLILIRHGCSEANERLYREGNRWGDPNFTDDTKYIDATLSAKGKEQAQSLLRKSDALHQIVQKLKDGSLTVTDKSKETKSLSNEVLIVTSPLTRTIETLSIGILSHLNDNNNDNAISVRAIAQPLATERIYTSSDTGRPISELEKDFPHIDFTDCHDYDSIQGCSSLKEWWYTHNQEKDGRYLEWRPSDESQYYAVPGEPQHAFDDRMSRLFQWIESRMEQTIILVTHWGVIRYITDEEDVENCGVRIIDVNTLRSKR